MAVSGAQVSNVVPAAPQGPAPGTAWDLPTYLSRYPWPAEWTRLGRPLEYFWRFDLPVSRESIWPFLSDTSAFNQRLNVSRMRFVEKDGRLYGSATNGGVKQSWEELPWEWEYARGLNNVRLYSEGFVHVVRVRYILEDDGPDRCRLYVYFGWIPKGLKGKLLIKIGLPQMEKDYRRVLPQIAEAIRSRVSLPPAQPPPPLSEESANRLADIRTQLLKAGLDPAQVGMLLHCVETATDEEIYRIRVKVLAREWKLSEQNLLVTMLHATRLGLLTLTWDMICPHCRGTRAELTHLGELPKTGECTVCGIEFDTTSISALEVTFHVHPSIRKVEKRWFCSAEPATKPHIQIQKTLQPGQQVSIPTLLAQGRYRLRIKGERAYTFLDVDHGSSVAALDWRDTEAGLQLQSRTFPTLHLQNTAAVPRTFILERNAEDRDRLRPVDLFCFQEFRDLFSQEAVASDMHLDIGQQTILFTDLVGSTKFYEAEGDSVAFAEVRKHFVKAYDSVKANDGVIVKTIGDAVMAAFSEPLKALRAAHQLQMYFTTANPQTRLRLRITLHTGPCLAVNLNQNIDYFGSTVNMAAKLQTLAEGGQIAFSDSVARDQGVARFLAELNIPVEKLTFTQKWSGNEVPAFRISVS